MKFIVDEEVGADEKFELKTANNGKDIVYDMGAGNALQKGKSSERPAKKFTSRENWFTQGFPKEIIKLWVLLQTLQTIKWFVGNF